MIENGINSLELTKKTTNDYIYEETVKRIKEKIKITSDPTKKLELDVNLSFIT